MFRIYKGVQVRQEIFLQVFSNKLAGFTPTMPVQHSEQLDAVHGRAGIICSETSKAG